MSNSLFKVMCSGASTGETIPDGDGTSIATPYIWDLHCESNRYQSKIFNNYESNYEDYSKIYIKVRLLAGITYDIGMNNDKPFDGKIWLYDIEGNELLSNDDYTLDINGIPCKDVIQFTPETDGNYIIAPGCFGTNQYSGGEFYIVMNPAPELFQGDSTELGTKNNPYIFSDIIDPSYSYWTYFINVNPGDGAWIKVELSWGYNWIIGVSLNGVGDNYVDGYLQLYDYNFFHRIDGTIPPDNYLEVEGIPVGAAIQYYNQYEQYYYIKVMHGQSDKKSLRLFCIAE